MLDLDYQIADADADADAFARRTSQVAFILVNLANESIHGQI